MDVTMRHRKAKKGLIVKTWERCKSLGRNRTTVPHGLVVRSKSWSVMDEEGEEKRVRKRRVAPEGCFTVYVGPERRRFVIKTEYANHPLFKTLLEEAESEYGYCIEGPLSLPCNVDVFCHVLLEMDGHHDSGPEIRRGCGFVGSHSSYRLLASPF